MNKLKTNNIINVIISDNKVKIKIGTNSIRNSNINWNFEWAEKERNLPAEWREQETDWENKGRKAEIVWII